MGFLAKLFKRSAVPDANLKTHPSIVSTWQRLTAGSGKAWVLFENGTCVLVEAPGADFRNDALDLMREWGPVRAGTPAADFKVVRLRDGQGWVVISHYPNLSTHVSPAEVPEDQRSDVAIGLFGRGKRHKDATELVDIHTEPARTP